MAHGPRKDPFNFGSYSVNRKNVFVLYIVLCGFLHLLNEVQQDCTYFNTRLDNNVCVLRVARQVYRCTILVIDTQQ